MRLRAILVLLLFALWCWLQSRRRCKEGIPITEPDKPLQWLDRWTATYADVEPEWYAEYDGKLHVTN